MDDERHDHDRGLAFDLSTLVNRRRALQLFGGAGLVALVGCASNGGSSSTATTSASSASSATSAASATTAAGSATTAAAGTTATTAAAVDTSTPIPEETAGPFPGDGSNGPNVLTQSGIVRSDIRASFGSSSGLAQGVPLTISMQVLDSASGSPMAGAAVYVWHCDIEGRYSMYSDGVTDENYLRGVQEAGSDGKVNFTSIFPAAYSGRWPHIHFEVYPSLAEATKAGTTLATSQIALPEETCDLVYATDGYNQSVRNLSRTSLATDMVFRDGWDQELATMSGSIDNGLTAFLPVPV
jgi:protocatechuate 3,4-dioxygenase beta subunit